MIGCIMPIMSDEITQDQPIAQRDSRGRMLAPLPGAHSITKADASQLAKKRWENYRRAAVTAVKYQVSKLDPTATTGAKAFAVVVAKKTMDLMLSPNPSFADVEKLQRIMTGESSSESRRENATPPGAITADPGALMDLVRMIEQDKRAAADAAGAIDGESNG